MLKKSTYVKLRIYFISKNPVFQLYLTNYPQIDKLKTAISIHLGEKT